MDSVARGRGAWRLPRRRSAFLGLAGILVLVAVAAATIGVTALMRGPAAVSSSTPRTEYSGTPLGWQAPDFELTDQTGTRIWLSDFRGNTVVLAFMDSRCDESCPLTAFQLRLANLALNEGSGSVVFLGVNVNRDFNSVADVSRFTNTYLLHEIPTWRFLTGDIEELSAVWDAYSIEVIDQSDQEDYEHTPGVFVIDRNGLLRWYVSIPLEGEGASAWDGRPLNEILAARIRGLGTR